MGGPGSGRKRKDGPDKRPAGSTSKKRSVATQPDSDIDDEVVEPLQLARQPAGSTRGTLSSDQREELIHYRRQPRNQTQ
ncbi:hypothetical protein HaLaN_30469 [Haematococcus lacustris]|uniref:Uncharacterized protein n=1 Tax=Haematococcus lacustris TaxID=44745 RepID=A0A6A0AHC1_HAELA|nr:hypothetical protein HaLaN_30469 [Haematococcus lacustris]